MDEKQILEQLNQFKQIKPRENWVASTRKELFEEHQQQPVTARLASALFSPLDKPVLALTSIAVLALMTGSTMLYSPQLVEIDEPMPVVEQDQVVQQNLTASLENLDNSLQSINSNLERLKQTKDMEALGEIAAIEATARYVKQSARTMATNSTDPETRAALTNIEESSDQTIDASQEAYAGALEVFIDELESRKQFLSSEDQTRLEKAKDAYQAEDYYRTYLLLRKWIE